MSLLHQINGPSELKQINTDQLPQLAMECRAWLLDALKPQGGHLAASLGVTELTIALHYCFDTLESPLLWDVGHQAYVHKLLTGRKALLHTIRQQHGLTPFPDPAESQYDGFTVGHASNAISAALGMALAKALQGNDSLSIAIIGDGGLTGGMAFEALNHAGNTEANLLIIVNDNQMSISENVGALNGKLDETFFQSLGLSYQGPIDGHDFSDLLAALQNTAKENTPRVLHIKTQKGRGYPAAEEDPIGYHAVKAELAAASQSKHTFSGVFGDWLLKQGMQCPQLVAITPAMCIGSDLTEFALRYLDRYVDVGIAEQHATTLAGGFAKQGMKPVLAIYSTFLQRAYDQVIHDLAIQNLDVLIAIDRAGLVGGDGATHQGTFDLAYLRTIPNVLVMAPADFASCREMLTLGYEHPGVCAVRYPKGAEPELPSLPKIEWGKAACIRKGKKRALLAFGALLETALKVGEHLNATVVDMRFVKPLDTGCIHNIAKTHSHIVTLEDGAVTGGAGSAVLEHLARIGYQGRTQCIGIPDQFIAHASRDEQFSACGLDIEGVLSTIMDKNA